MTTYAQQVSESFQLTTTERFGDGHTTGHELSALYLLHKWLGRNREATIEHVIFYGYPTPDELTPEMIAVTGAAHACGVTEHLAEERGLEGMESTYESYTIKNRFDRFVRLHVNDSLQDEWDRPIPREQGFINNTISYPNGVDETLIHGGALPHRFLPAQAIRYLEFARLGKLDDNTKALWGINANTDLELFRVDWDTLIPAIASSETTQDLIVNIARKIVSQLQENGLDNDRIKAVISKGFNTSGMRSEHGDFEGLSDIESLIDSISV